MVNQINEPEARDACVDESKRKTVNLPVITDVFGGILSHILISPLFGDKYKFADPREAVKFVADIPSTFEGKDIPLAYIDITVHYSSGSRWTLNNNDKAHAIRFLAGTFGIECPPEGIEI